MKSLWTAVAMVLLLNFLAMAGGVPVALASLGEAAGLPDDRMEDLLERLARTGAVGREDEGWVALPPGKAAGG